MRTDPFHRALSQHFALLMRWGLIISEIYGHIKIRIDRHQCGFRRDDEYSATEIFTFTTSFLHSVAEFY